MICKNNLLCTGRANLSQASENISIIRSKSKTQDTSSCYRWPPHLRRMKLLSLLFTVVCLLGGVDGQSVPPLACFVFDLSGFDTQLDGAVAAGIAAGIAAVTAAEPAIIAAAEPTSEVIAKPL